jgi:hypothetical protein
MGACASTSEFHEQDAAARHRDTGGGETSTSPFESVPPILKDRSALGDSEDSSRVGSLTMTRLRSTTRAALHLEFLTEVRAPQGGALCALTARSRCDKTLGA